MRGWLILIVIVVALGAGVAIYTNTHQLQTPVDSTIIHIVPDVVSVGYRNAEFGFSIKYPETATSSDVNLESYLPLTQTPIVSFVLPRDMFAGTNLRDAGVYIGATSTPKLVASCGTSSPETGETAEGTTTIDGATFSIFKSAGAGAGNFYETKVYRTVRGEMCFEIAELLHSTDVGNYPEGTVVEFDKTEFQGYLGAMLQTFRFF